MFLLPLDITEERDRGVGREREREREREPEKEKERERETECVCKCVCARGGGGPIGSTKGNKNQDSFIVLYFKLVIYCLMYVKYNLLPF